MAPNFARAGRVLRRVGVGHHLQPRHAVRPREQGDHFAGERRLHRRHFAGVDMAGAPVDGDDVALVERGLADDRIARLVVDDDLLATGNTGFAHAARHHRGVGCLAAAARQDSLRLEEAVDVFRLGFLAHQYDFFAGAAACLGGVGVENDFS